MKPAAWVIWGLRSGLIATLIFVIVYVAGHEYINHKFKSIAFPNDSMRQLSRKQLRKLMKYHGIDYAYQKDDGEWYFKRDGQECRLERRAG